MKQKWIIGLACGALVSACTAPQVKAPANGVVIVGDGRTAADPAVPASEGWGPAFCRMTAKDYPARSLATPGARMAGVLEPAALERVFSSRPAFVIGGFGQDDAEAGTDLAQFRTALAQWVDQVRQHDATPILVTPPPLRTKDPVSAKIPDGMKLPANAQPYAEAIAAVAREKQVLVFDLRAEMKKIYAEIGERANWFMHPPFDITKEYPSNVREHQKWRSPVVRQPAYFSRNGAESLAHALVNMLRASDCKLKEKLLPLDGPPSPDYQLVWRDEFDGTRWDTNKWQCRYPGPRKDGINDPDCLRLDGKGNLIIDIKKVGDKYHAGMMDTAGRQEWVHGYFECRMTLAKEAGFWNAFWLMGDKVAAPGKHPELADQTRTNGVEIDVVEYLRTQGDVTHMNLHWNGYGDLHRSSPFDVFIPGFREQEWHTFGVEWRADGYTFYVDGRPCWETSDAPSDAMEHVILSVEVGKWAGDIAAAKLPQEVKVDWVRVWQKKV